MACGFYDFDQELYMRIHKASGKMLIFAAPTNESNAGEIVYPAQHEAEVFSMFSTNGSVTSSKHLNPTACSGQHHFAILGEDIVTHNGNVVSGTSLATANAAGFAGQMLEFSRHNDCRDKISNAYQMALKHGMKKVLLGMAVRDANFYCLKPWTLLPSNLRTLIPFKSNRYPSDAEIREARKYIRNFITLQLEGT